MRALNGNQPSTCERTPLPNSQRTCATQDSPTSSNTPGPKTTNALCAVPSVRRRRVVTFSFACQKSTACQSWDTSCACSGQVAPQVSASRDDGVSLQWCGEVGWSCVQPSGPRAGTPRACSALVGSISELEEGTVGDNSLELSPSSWPPVVEECVVQQIGSSKLV